MSLPDTYPSSDYLLEIADVVEELTNLLCDTISLTDASPEENPAQLEAVLRLDAEEHGLDDGRHDFSPSLLDYVYLAHVIARLGDLLARIDFSKGELQIGPDRIKGFPPPRTETTVVGWPPDVKTRLRALQRELTTIKDWFGIGEDGLRRHVEYPFAIVEYMRICAGRLRKAVEAKQPSEQIEWSKLIGYKELRAALQISQNTLKGMLAEGTKPVEGHIRHKKAHKGTRKFQVAVGDLPADVQGRFRRTK